MTMDTPCLIKQEKQPIAGSCNEHGHTLEHWPPITQVSCQQHKGRTEQSNAWALLVHCSPGWHAATYSPCVKCAASKLLHHVHCP